MVNHYCAPSTLLRPKVKVKQTLQYEQLSRPYYNLVDETRIVDSITGETIGFAAHVRRGMHE